MPLFNLLKGEKTRDLTKFKVLFYIIKHCCINNSYQLNTLIGKDYDDYGYCLKSLNKDYIISLNNDLGFIGLKQ